MLFVDDQTHRAATADEWHVALEKAHAELGVERSDFVRRYTASVLLPALRRDELVPRG